MKNKLLTLGSIACAMTINAQGNYEKDLILNYRFKDKSGTTLVKDLSSQKNHGTIKGVGSVISQGEIYLPGGNTETNGAYIELPKGMFDNQNTLTISMWLKNENNKGNFAAIHIIPQ